MKNLFINSINNYLFDCTVSSVKAELITCGLVKVGLSHKAIILILLFL